MPLFWLTPPPPPPKGDRVYVIQGGVHHVGDRTWLRSRRGRVSV